LTDRPDLPGFVHFAWMFFMQPVSLHNLLKAAGIENPDASGWKLWFRPGPDREIRRFYVRRLAALLLAVPPMAFGLSLCLDYAGVGIDYAGMGLGVGLGVTFIVTGVAGPVFFGVAFGVAGGVVFGVALGMARGEAVSVAAIVAFGVTFSVAIGVSLDVASDAFVRVLEMVGGLLLGFLVGTLAFSIAKDAVIGVAAGVTIIVFLFRIRLYPVEALWQTMLFVRHRLVGTANLAASPVLWHELSYLPLPFLGRHIELTAERDPALAQRAIDACDRSPGQHGVGLRALARLQARELERIAHQRRFRDFGEGETNWLSADPYADPLIGDLRQTARYLARARIAAIPHNRRNYLEQARKALDRFDLQLLFSENRRPLAGVLGPWRAALNELHSSTAEVGLPNPFRAGDPLKPEQGDEVFRGRDDVARRIEILLADPRWASSIALLGPRRCGKTSLLRMLPAMLPDTVCIFFDLQGHPVDSPAGLFQALARETREQARQSRGLSLPALGEGPPFDTAAAWIEALERAAGERRILLCLDEFETLERSFPGSRSELLRLMGLFRATIQHRRRVRLLVSGEAPFDELDAVWNDYFISVREVRIGHLDPGTALDLVRRPIPEFPADAVPAAVAERIVERTGAQPYLVQLYAQLLVEALNARERTQATLDDLEAIELEVLEQATYYFRNTWQRAPAPARSDLAALARGTAPGLERESRRWLVRRCLIDDQGRLTIPVLGRFLIEEELA